MGGAETGKGSGGKDEEPVDIEKGFNSVSFEFARVRILACEV